MVLYPVLISHGLASVIMVELEWLVSLLATMRSFDFVPSFRLDRVTQVLRKRVCKLLLRRGVLLVFGLLQPLLLHL